jgi:hypothetical protein
MTKIALGKLLRSIILKKYDWIVNYKIDNYSYGFGEIYAVYYFVDSPDMNHIDEGVQKEVKKTTEQLFKALGPGRSASFGGVEFINIGKKLS